MITRPHPIKLLVATLTIGIILFAGLFLYFEAEAVPGLPFGGFVNTVFVCTCSPGVVLQVGPPVGGNYLVLPGTLVYEYGQVRAGVWVLGDYSPGGVCLHFVGKACVTFVPVTGTVNFMGTSL